MGVKVYFEGGNCSWADHVATFADEECYDICIEALEKYADDNGCIVTESVEEGSSELDRAVAAIRNVLDTPDVLAGNAVHAQTGELYPDVKQGLQEALELLDTSAELTTIGGISASRKQNVHPKVAEAAAKEWANKI